MALLQNDIIYFILTDRFYGVPNKDVKIDKNHPKGYHGGNFEGIIEKIPYLKKLGITALWITPVYLQVPDPEGKNYGLFGYHGYWALDFNSIDPYLYIDNGKYPKGSKLYLKDLVDKLHENGIKLVLDMVVNHTGYLHPGTNNSEPNPTPIRQHWFNNLTLSCDYDEIQGQLAGLPDMDLDQPDVCDYHIQTILSWIKETGLDAIRMDTAKHVERSFWYDYKTHVKGRYPNVSLLGEVLLFSIEEISQYQKHFAFDSLFDFPVQRAMEWVFAWNNSMETFVSAFNKGTGILEKDGSYTDHHKLTSLLDNHDLPTRYMTTALYAAENNKEDATQIMMLSLSFMFTIRGIPQIYYGTEVGMEGGLDPDNRRDFEWHLFDKNYNVLPKYKLEKKIFDLTCKLIQIRKDNPALFCGSFICIYVDHFLMAYLRHHDDNVVIVVVHNGWYKPDQGIDISVFNHSLIPQRIKDIVCNKTLTCQITGEKVTVKDGVFNVRMEGKSALILK
jgi:glycosidase